MGARSSRGVVGVVGGGQLCLLLGEETRRARLPYDLVAVDPTGDCPARPILRSQIVADVRDPEAIHRLAVESDVVTFEAEPAAGAALEDLERSRAVVHPSPATLRILQDKPALATLLKSKGLPGAEGSRPADVAAEISVIAVRSAAGEVRTYSVAENLYADGVLQTTIAPARVAPAVAAAADALARETVAALGAVGVVCVEMFADAAGRVLLKAIVPRVHNSGHFTIEACRTSQFEQHVRAITGMPLGETTLLYAAVTVKILGAPGLQGPVTLEGVDAVRMIPGASVHLYGRKETSPGRVLGHVTLTDVLDPGYRDALVHRADHVRRMIVQKEAKR